MDCEEPCETVLSEKGHQRPSLLTRHFTPEAQGPESWGPLPWAQLWLELGLEGRVISTVCDCGAEWRTWASAPWLGVGPARQAEVR